jgi:hypothetical protein
VEDILQWETKILDLKDILEMPLLDDIDKVIHLETVFVMEKNKRSFRKSQRNETRGEDMRGKFL